MNKRRIADLAQEWNEVIERLNYDDFQAWFLLLPEKERLIVAQKLVAGIIYFCRDYLTVPQEEPIWEMEERCPRKNRFGKWRKPWKTMR